MLFKLQRNSRQDSNGKACNSIPASEKISSPLIQFSSFITIILQYEGGRKIIKQQQPNVSYIFIQTPFQKMYKLLLWILGNKEKSFILINNNLFYYLICQACNNNNFKLILLYAYLSTLHL